MHALGAPIYWLCVWFFLHCCQAAQQIVFEPIDTMGTPFEAAQSGMQRVKIEYTHNGVREDFNDVPLFQNASATLPSLGIDLNLAVIDQDTLELSYTLTAQAKVVRLHYLEFLFDMHLQDSIMMADGYQAWTHSREADRYSRIPTMSKAVAWLTKFDLQGDYWFFPYSGRAGVIHSTSYTYFKNVQDKTLVFFGSVSEETGYTYFRADLNGDLFSIYKDIDGKELLKGDTLKMRVVIMQRKDTDLNAVWERFAQFYLPPGKTLQPRHLSGWTSWYNYYERVTEQDILNSLDGFKEHGYPIDVFQIDDGYETAVGDWLDIVDSKFPKGMKYLAAQISEAGYIPGLWLAPYAVGFKSRIVKEHPEWLVKHDNGSFLVAGPNWGGFYALNIYNEGAREYLRKVFDVVLDDWGYRLLKLDFIFAAAMLPQQGKSRGEVLWESVDLIQQFTRGRAAILGSGIPLAATWGKFEYCRVSSDASPYWDQTTLRVAHVRERVATNNALTSTLHRWYMSHVFGPDPDVFFLRSNNNKLNNHERYTTCAVNNIMGQLTLMSDDIRLYSAQEHRLYASTFPKVQMHVESSESIGADVYRVLYTANGRRYRTYVNMSPLPHQVRLPEGREDTDIFFEQQNPLLGNEVLWHKAGDQLLLKPHETRTFLHITDRFAGSTGHLVPGWDVESFQEKDDTVQITMRQGRHVSDSYIFMLRQDDEPEIYIDGSLVTAEQYLSSNGVRLVRVRV